MIEEWRPISGYRGSYEVSDLGRVRSLDRINAQGRFARGRILKTDAVTAGHLQVGLCRDGRKRNARVHRLVLLTFVGRPPSGTEGCHRDGDPTNNALTNLYWGTSSKNIHDQVAHGTHRNSRKTHCPQGHPYDETNTYTTSRGRACRPCKRARTRARRAAARRETT